MPAANRVAPQPRILPRDEESDRRTTADVETSSTPATGWQPGQNRVVVDSALSVEAASVHPAAPALIQKNQRVIDVQYVGFDGRMHAGQLVADRRLVDDLKAVFALALQLKFPVQSVVPVSVHAWSDDASMRVNNTSGFNYRETTGGGSLSKHAFGYAIDLNPRINPYIRNGKMEPSNGEYDVAAPGTLTADHPLVQKFKELGWSWGGDWTTHKDYQHFEKPLPAEYEAYNAEQQARRPAR